MQPKQTSHRLAQSASALGAGILGFGLGAKWGHILVNYALPVMITGALIHVLGMYLMQMKGVGAKSTRAAKILLVSAWICLLALVIIVTYLLTEKE
ncbi:hypothetical protein [Sediminibacterium soli]|uniref:hypothetical protein n=1 Tax=Sediminibacterium soli TaxID=2698829 RepID=UPI0013795BB4|nr:hypothetical protein [Sediminibacterium soli]NCI47430.1 hypothetical protein [Sediminibacterium soli]